MDANKTTIERAFDLAGSGTCLTVNDIVSQLKLEGYAKGQIEGRSLNKQLRELIEKATKPHA